MKTGKDLKEIIQYDESTGVFTWLKTMGQRALKGNTAGTVNWKGYLIISICGKTYRAHRLAFIIKGIDIPSQIDHIDGNKLNNRFENLRLANAKINTQNRVNFKNKTGFSGVQKMPSGRYRTVVELDGKQFCSKVFDSPEEAHQEWIELKKKHHVGFARWK